MQGTNAAGSTQGGMSDEVVGGILKRVQREPALRSWLLSAPTGALASLGVTLDDHEIVQLLDAVGGMDDRPVPVTARDIMSADPITVQPSQSVHEAAQILAEKRISGLPVCDAQNNLVGVLSEFDLIARQGSTVADVMSRDVVVAKEDTAVGQVRAILVGRRLKRVPVVDGNGRLIGIVTRADLVRELAYRWVCGRCGQLIRARRAPEGACPRCGAVDSFEPAPPEPLASTCPTCGKPLEE